MKKNILILACLLMLLAAVVWAAAYGTVSVSGTPVHIYTATSAATSIGVFIQNDPASTVTVYLGSDAGVNATNHGPALIPGAGVILNGHLNDWYAVTAGSAANVNSQLLF